LDIPFLAIAGSEDSSWQYLNTFSKDYQGNDIEILSVPGADHIFNVLTPNKHFSDLVIDKTVQWLRKTLLGTG
jgi:hypothetical protein